MSYDLRQMNCGCYSENDIEYHIPYVLKILHSFPIKDNMIGDDLIQEGCKGLMIAKKKYDHNRNVKFLTYAKYWIFYYMNTYIQENQSMLKFDKRYKNTKWWKELGIDEEEFLIGVISPVNINEVQDINDIKQYDMEKDLIEKTEHSKNLKILQEAINQIYEESTEVEKKLIRKRILSETPTKVKDLAKEIGVTFQAVSLRCKNIEKKMKNKFYELKEGGYK